MHQIVLDNIRDCSVEESDGHGFTLRHGRRNRLVRLSVRMHDKRVVVPGLLNRAGALAGQHSPRAVALPLIGRIWRNI